LSNGGADLPEVGPWAREKLDRLRAYLGAYTIILSKQRWAKSVYVDAFAAAGRAAVRSRPKAKSANLPLLDWSSIGDSEAREVIDGSPRVALSVDPPFNYYVFIERDPERLKLLHGLREEFKGREVLIREQDCNGYLKERFASPDLKKKGYRAVVFLDPFGMQVPWSTLELLAKTGAVEVIINFPVGMAIQRLLRRDAKLTPNVRSKLDDYFGDPGWYEVVYSAEQDLFGDVVRKADDAADRLVDWYRRRLKAAFGHASPARLIKNSHGGHLYYLVFAGPNETGLKIASQVLLKRDAPS
jgi:three-Cys-motif partner protein